MKSPYSTFLHNLLSLIRFGVIGDKLNDLGTKVQEKTDEL